MGITQRIFHREGKGKNEEKGEGNKSSINGRYKIDRGELRIE